MSNEQPPQDDDQDVAEYQRADPSKFPTTPTGQQAAVEGTAAAKGWTSFELIRDARRVEATKAGTFGRIADELNRQGVPTDTPTGRLAAQMFALFEEFEQERRAEIIGAGGSAEDADDDGWGDPLTRSNLRSVARAHRNANQPHRAKAGDLDRLLDDLADEFNLADVRIIRGVAAALADAMPRIAHKHREQGMSPDEIARETGYTASRVAQFIRQERERRAAPGALRRYTWRTDVQNADGAWTDREAGEDESTPADLAQLAERLLTETGAHGQRARIFLWEGDEGTDAEAVHTAERPAQWDAFLTVEQHDGKEWRGLSDESVPSTTEEPGDLARRVLGNAREQMPAATLRVRVWRFGTSEGPHLAEAIATDADRVPDDQ